MRANLFLLGCLTAGSMAAPTLLNDIYDYSSDLATYLGKVSKYIESTGEELIKSANSCDTSKISLPSYASSLPSPSGMSPIYVAVGRGTQVSRRRPAYCHTVNAGGDPAGLTSPSLELHLCHLDLGLNAPSHRCSGASLQRDLHRGQLPGHVVVTPGYSVQGTVAQ